MPRHVYQSPMGKVKTCRIGEIGEPFEVVSYQSPMGKEKTNVEASVLPVAALYQSPMGKVKTKRPNYL